MYGFSRLASISIRYTKVWPTWPNYGLTNTLTKVGMMVSLPGLEPGAAA